MEPETKTYTIEADGRQAARRKAREMARTEGFSLKIRKMKALEKNKKFEISGIIKKRAEKPKKNGAKAKEIKPGDTKGETPKGLTTATSDKNTGSKKEEVYTPPSKEPVKPLIEKGTIPKKPSNPSKPTTNGKKKNGK